MAYTDVELAAAVAAHDFEVGDDGRPLLPAATTPLGKRLGAAVITNEGAVNSALGPLAAQALGAKGFQLAEGTGGRLGLPRDTIRASGTRQPPMTDVELARAVRAHDFEVGDDGRPLLPAATTPLGKRLGAAVITNEGAVNAALGPMAAQALGAKGFQLAEGTGGRLGLPRDTPHAGQLHRVGEADALRAGFADARPGTQPEPTGSAQQLSPYRTEIAAMIYADYQQSLYHGRWPEIPPSGLKVAVAHEGTESGLGQGPIVVTLDVPGDAHEPVGGSGRPAGMTDEMGDEVTFLADPSLDFADPALAEALWNQGITPAQYEKASHLQEIFLQDMHWTDYIEVGAREISEDAETLQPHSVADQPLPDLMDWNYTPVNPIATQALTYQPPSGMQPHPQTYYQNPSHSGQQRNASPAKPRGMR
ncbi:hypothetical protein [Streptomyces sp. NPDC097610]|uniref:hypothetical protein n=1 Tax=Streptomyces sp. NPDC097610 TaxID=3157227 RepID=UPI00333185C8